MEGERDAVAPWDDLPDELVLTIVRAIETAACVASARLVCARWARIGGEVMRAIHERWRADLVDRLREMPASYARCVLASAIVRDRPHVVEAALNSSMVGVDERVIYGDLMAWRGHVCLSRHDHVPSHHESLDMAVRRFHEETDRSNTCPLAWAACCGALKCMDVLIAHGAHRSWDMASIIGAVIVRSCDRERHICRFPTAAANRTMSGMDIDFMWDKSRPLPPTDTTVIVGRLLAVASRPPAAPPRSAFRHGPSPIRMLIEAINRWLTRYDGDGLSMLDMIDWAAGVARFFARNGLVQAGRDTADRRTVLAFQERHTGTPHMRVFTALLLALDEPATTTSLAA